MKYLLRTIRLKLLLPAATALALICATSAEEKKSTSVELVKLRKDLGELQAQVSETTATLEVLRNAGKSGSGLQTAYKNFAEKFDRLESHLAGIRAESTKMRARAEDHYRAWQEDLTKMGNPKLREKALNRFEDAKEEFDEIIVIAEEAKREIGPFMSDLKDVAIYLKTDLSKDAVKTLSNSIWKLGNKSRAVVASIQHVTGQISRALDQLPEGK